MKEHKYLKEKKKKKSFGRKLCIFLIAVFTLVMVADIANFFLTPAQSPMGFGPSGGFDMAENSGFTMPEGGEMPSGDFQMPEGGDFQMPEGSQMPGGFTPGEEDGQMPSFGGEAPSFDGEMPSFGDMPGGNRGGRGGGLLQTVRSAWLPIAIVCVLGDLVCILILVRIRRKEKALAQACDNESGLPPLIEDENPDEPPKRKRGPWVLLLCLALVFALILSMFPTGEEAVSSADVHQELVSGTAQAAQIQTVLSGAGTLEADTLTPVTVPQQVTVLSYHVRNGEKVKAGDPLVSVDKTSAASAVMELSELMEDLDDDLNSEKTKSQSARIASTTSGRVKKIYAQEGDKVSDVLYEHGALMLLSLDGYMKVTFESDRDLSVGDTVTVQYSGETEEGRITTVRLGKVTVTLSDEDAPYGTDATVLSESGETLGEGTLEINSEMKIIGYYGTVEKVRVEVGDKVTPDNTLFSLKNVGKTTNYQLLLSRRSELETQLQKLTQLARTGTVYAETDGVVSGVPEDADIELLSSTSGGWKVVLLTESTPVPTTVYRAAKITVIAVGMVMVNYYEDNTGTILNENSDPSTFANNISQGNIDIFSKTDIQPDVTDSPEAGGYLLYEVGTDANNSTTRKFIRYVSAKKEPSTPASMEGYYAAKLLDKPGATLRINYNPTALTDKEAAGVDLTVQESGMTSSGDYTSSVSAKNDVLLNGSTVKVSDLQAGDLVLLYFQNGIVTNIARAQRLTALGQNNQGAGNNNQNAPGTGTNNQNGPPSGDASFDKNMGEDGASMDMEGEMEAAGGTGGGMPSSGGGVSGMPSGMGSTQEQTYENYVVKETELLSISGQEDVSLTITLDELDVLAAAVGMDAQVTLDAMKGQSFSGTIKRIGHEGTNDGGNTKFTVTIVLPRQESMLDGMNASVKIVTATSDAAVAVPAAALVEEDGKTYVYTTYDTETDTLGGLVEVETGASDGEMVEILAGMNAGDLYYHRYADTVTYSFLASI